MRKTIIRKEKIRIHQLGISSHLVLEIDHAKYADRRKGSQSKIEKRERERKTAEGNHWSSREWFACGNIVTTR
jgi:hypothetical protein